MNNFQKLSMDEIIFENRNKMYGAFQLRQTIDRNSTIGLLITITAFITLMLLVKISIFKNYKSPIIEKVIICTTQDIPDIVVDIPKIKNTTIPKELPKVNSTMFKDFKVVQSIPATQQPPATQDQLIDKNIAKEDIKDGIDGPMKPVEPITASLGSGTPDVTPTPIEKPVIVVSTILKTSEILPTFPNGKEALMKYLRDNIHPHDADIETGASGKVIIRFYIDTDGTVREPEIIKDGIGGRCAEVAISAIKKMPRWKPGMQNGSPVKVYFTLPVAFDFSRN